MFVDVGGMSIFYQQTGEGAPVILLHGNGEDHTIFDTIAARLARAHTVFALDSRGHGQSGAADSLSYQDMAQDVMGFIEALSLSRPALVGFSDGGIVGLLVASQRPGLLGALVLCGANTTPSGLRARWRLMMRAGFLISRDEKLRLMLTQPQITPSALARIQAPTLVLAGGRDIIAEGHTRALAKNIPGSRLEILPGETHDSYVKNADLFCGVVAPFLGGQAEEKPAVDTQ